METSTQQTFAVGSTYIMRSPCDFECTWTYTVARRTAKSVWVCLHHTGQDINPAKAQRVSIRVHDGEETCRPLGSYSMSPILAASKEI